ncbi:HEXXH motif domain-containing protein [Actinomadura sp. ATCC 31491]|uniref:HEXXH motif domain-containing protein n=1 Tax=Actinomadura luzonensis TaxID=2805427 RepID=A0ABT0G581_9ACTN|nr:HEXXH motif domain-containing protein [Actinomadura luzonensis]MCK2219659.1 HEXXH motif domain-containing protein [Actinomadura luzonensis]
MTPAAHRVSDAAFAALATGGGGATAVGELCAAQASKHRLLVRLLAEESEAARRAYETLAELEDGAPEEVSRCLRHPAVGAWALRACRGRADPGRLAAVALAAAVRAGAACRLEVPAGGRLMLPSLGLLTLPPGGPDRVMAAVEPDGDGAGVRVGALAVRVVPGRDGPGWQALHRLPFGPHAAMTVDDLDPYRWPGDDVDGRLTEARRHHWSTCLGQAWDVLRASHRTVAAEVTTAVSVLTPILAGAREQHSASARDLFGAIALSDPLDGIGLALTLTHELQHAKLYALSDLVALTRPDDGRRFYAPWRPDPRPLEGLLHGAYAHAGVAAFWRRHLSDAGHGARAEVEFARWREAAHQVTGTLLDSGGLTEEGIRFVATLRDRLSLWLEEPVSAAAARQARLIAEGHRRAWAAGPAGARWLEGRSRS